METTGSREQTDAFMLRRVYRVKCSKANFCLKRLLSLDILRRLRLRLGDTMTLLYSQGHSIMDLASPMMLIQEYDSHSVV